MAVTHASSVSASVSAMPPRWSFSNGPVPPRPRPSLRRPERPRNQSPKRRKRQRPPRARRSLSKRKKKAPPSLRTRNIHLHPLRLPHPRKPLSFWMPLSLLDRVLLVLNVLAVVFVFGVVAAVLPGKVDLVFLCVSVVKVGRSHLQNLGGRDEKVQQVDDLDTSVLFVKLLVFGPPFPRDAVGEFGDFLGHCAAVVEHPLLALFVGHVDSVDADAFVELLLKAEKFVEFVGLCHRENIISRSCRKSLLFWRKRQA